MDTINQQYQVKKSGNRYCIFSPKGLKFVDAYPLFLKFHEFGYKRVAEFVIDYSNNTLPAHIKSRYKVEIDEFDKKRRYENKIEGFKKKLRKEEIMKIRAELKEKYPDLKYSERELMIAELIKEPEKKKVIDWKFVNQLNIDELQQLKSLLRMDKPKIYSILDSITIDTEYRFATVKSVYDYLNDYTNLSEIFSIPELWVECPFLKGHRSLISIKNYVDRVMSFNVETKKGYIFNLFDLFGLYDIEIGEIIKRKEIKVDVIEYTMSQLEKLKNERARIKSVISSIENDKITEYRTLCRYLKPHLSFYKDIVSIAVENVISTNYLNNEGKAVFFASTRYVSDRLKNITYQNVAKKINILCVLGLLNKCSNKKLPASLTGYENGREYDINYLTIPEIDFQETERRAEILSNNKITERNFSRTKIAALFGEEFASTIFQSRKEKSRLEEEFIDTRIIEEDENETFVEVFDDLPF